MQTIAVRLEAVSEIHEYRLSEVLSALSHALDLTEGQPPGHTLRATAIGMRFGEELGLSDSERAALFYSLLLKDAGCSVNSSAVADRFGSDDGPVKRDLKTRDWSSLSACAAYAWDNAAKGGRVSDRLRHFTRVAIGGKGLARELVRVRCHRGAEIVTRLGFPDASADAIRCLDEHWDGRGQPHGFAGDAIPLASRIAGLAQTLEVFLTAKGSAAAMAVVKERRGTWFDPDLVDLCLKWRHDHAWWSDLLEDDLAARVQAMEPGEHARILDDDGLDRVAEAFAEIIDAKSPYTSAHSTNVARFATGIGDILGLDDVTLRSMYRAGLLHDIGKLGVSNRILDKAAPLTPEERDVMAQHPLFTWSILRRVGAFRDFARIASLHHERLDGSGYPWGLGDDELDVASRVLAIADVYEALTARRPYRDGLPVDHAMSIIGKDTPFRYDGHVFTALERWLAR
jgi:HD-GYP domain-containing protein (c-di-GMP phosphodiesterase class II)